MQLPISTDLEHLISQCAAKLGFSSVEAYLRAALASPTAPPANIMPEEFERLLDELASDDVPSLPADFSRADIYGEHP